MARPAAARAMVGRSGRALVLAPVGAAMALVIYEGWRWLGETDGPCDGIFADCLNQALDRASRWAAAVVVVVWLVLLAARIRPAWLVTGAGVVAHLGVVYVVAVFGDVPLVVDMVVGALVWVAVGSTVGRRRRRQPAVDAPPPT